MEIVLPTGNDYGDFAFLFGRGMRITENLSGKKVAILSTDGFEQVELIEPKKALEQGGAKTQDPCHLSPQWGNKRMEVYRVG